jgi:hypothetical protein
MEEVTNPDYSKLVGMSLDQCGFGRELGVIISRSNALMAR